MPWNRERWAFEDGFGRRWRLWLAAAGESGGMRADEARLTIGDFVWACSSGRQRRMADSLEALHDALTGGYASRFADPFDDLDTTRRMWAEVGRTLERAAASGYLRVEREGEPHPFFVVDDAPDTLRSLDGPTSERAPVDWVGIALVDASGRALGDRPYRIQLDSGVVRQGRLDQHGIATVMGIEPGTCAIDCPFHAASEASVHVVADGEHAPGIAAAYGFEDFNDIWNDAENADLRALRPNPTVLAPGDELHVPARSPQSVSRPTGAQHRFVSKEGPLKLRVCLQDFLGRPIGNTSVELVTSDESEPLTTDGDGHFEADIAASARDKQLLFDEIDLPFAIGSLDPIDQESGRNARLFNLGYLLDPTDTDDDDDVHLAIEEFQADNDLPTTGVFDDATKAQLLDAYGC